MPAIDLFIRTKGRGRGSIDDVVRRTLPRHGLHQRGPYTFEDYNQEALATLQHLRGMPTTELNGMAQNALPGSNYAVSVGYQPVFIFRVFDAERIGKEIAEGYLAGKEGFVHKAWRNVAELADKVLHEGWPSSAPAVEFAVVVPAHDNFPATVAYSAKYGLRDGKAVLYNEDIYPRKIV